MDYHDLVLAQLNAHADQLVASMADEANAPYYQALDDLFGADEDLTAATAELARATELMRAATERGDQVEIARVGESVLQPAGHAYRVANARYVDALANFNAARGGTS